MNNYHNIREQIGQGNIAGVILQLKQLKDNPQLNSIIVQETRWTDLNNDIKNDIISNEEANRTRNAIVVSLLGIIDELEKSTPASFQEEKVEELLDEGLIVEIIQGERSSIRFYLVIAAILFLMGAGFIIWNLFSNNVGAIQILSGMLISSLGGFPLREIINRRDKISVLNVLVKRINMLSTGQVNSNEEVQRINELFWSIIENTMLKTVAK